MVRRKIASIIRASEEGLHEPSQYDSAVAELPGRLHVLEWAVSANTVMPMGWF